jgi:phosphomannomutase
MDWSIFRAYDIRGIYPTELDEEAYYRIAKAYTSLFKPETIVVGMDARLSSPPLKDSLTKGFLDVGVNVVDIGEITTDMLYFAVGAYNYSGGIVVSASHNPKEYNGMKMVREKATAISSDTGLFDIRDALKAEKDAAVSSETKGTYEKREILDEYIKHVLKFVDKETIRSFSFVGNANFGYVSKPVRRLVEVLKLNLTPLNFEPDGSFPKGPPDPMLPGNRTETESLTRNSDAEFAVAWDADADRVMFCDENGQFISGAYVTALLADILLEKEGKGNKVIFDPRVIWPTLEVVKRKGGQSIISKGGHAFMKDRMRSEDAIFAGEMSAHYYFRDNFYADNGIIPFLLVLEHLSREGKPLSEIMRPYTEGHFMSGELNYRVKDINEVVSAVKNKYGGQGTEDFTDGYSLESDGWRFNIRPSNTEPLLRLNIEARQQQFVDKIRAEIETIING